MQVFAYAARKRLRHLVLVTLVGEFGFFFRIRDERGLNQNAWNIGRF